MLFAVLALAQAGCGGHRQSAPPPSGPPRFDIEDSRLVWPLPIITTARITSGYGGRTDPIDGMRRHHGGVDIDGAAGEPIHAAGAGVVTFSGERSGYGLLLVIDHGRGLATWYGHCSRLLKSRGDRVDRGEVIGLIGSTGRASGSHLHFETRKHGRAFDPVSLLPLLKRL